MGLDSLLDAAGPLVEAQILRDLAEDVEDEDREELIEAARQLERRYQQKRLGRKNGVAPLSGLATSSPGADAPPTYPGDGGASFGGDL